MMRRFVETDDFDVLLTHSRYSLVDHAADEAITTARERGVAVVNAAVLGGGILAVGVGLGALRLRDGGLTGHAGIDRCDRRRVSRPRRRPARSR